MTAVRALLLLAALALAACQVDVGPTHLVRGSGVERTETRQVHDFDRVALDGLGTLTITQGTTEALTVQAEDNVLPLLHSDVEGGTLRLGPRDAAIDPTRPIRYDLTLKRLTGLEVTGAAQVRSAAIQSDQLAVKVTGAGRVDVDRLTASSLTVEITGTGDVRLAGEVSRQTVSISGAGAFRGGDLATQQATVDVTGAADCQVRVSEHLTVTISGAGHVGYIGSPTVDQHVSGAGRVTRAG
jgi:Putative auto-transporter adhesin, head GIN domain